MSTLSLNTRTPVRNTNPVKRNPSLKEALEELMAEAANHDENSPFSPVVRLKSMDPRNNAGGQRVIMIRRTPYAMRSEYEQALTTVSFGALLQWYHAGVIHRFPQEYRELAERDIVNHVHEQNKRSFRSAHSIRKRYEDLTGLFEDEIVHEHQPGDFEYERVKWQIEQTELELFDANAPDNFSRYTKFAHALESGLIQSASATKLVVQGMLLALCDTYPANRVKALPEGARGMLRRAIIDQRTDLENPKLVQALADLEKGDWLIEGTNEGIRQCAKHLLSLQGDKGEEG